MVVNIAMCLSLEKIDSDVLEELCQLYLEAFPEEERRPLEKWLKLIDEEPMFRILTVMKNGNFVGFMTYWTFPDFTYVEHFAIKPSYRGGGLGGVALKLSGVTGTACGVGGRAAYNVNSAEENLFL